MYIFSRNCLHFIKMKIGNHELWPFVVIKRDGQNSFEFHEKKDFSIVNKMVCNFGTTSKKCKPQTLPYWFQAQPSPKFWNPTTHSFKKSPQAWGQISDLRPSIDLRKVDDDESRLFFLVLEPLWHHNWLNEYVPVFYGFNEIM